MAHINNIPPHHMTSITNLSASSNVSEMMAAAPNNRKFVTSALAEQNRAPVIHQQKQTLRHKLLL